jgi:sirohydrochlorin ferrochelatase
VPPVGVDQELPAVVAQRQAEVVVDALVHAEADRQAEGGGELDPADALEIVHRFLSLLAANVAGAKIPH